MRDKPFKFTSEGNPKAKLTIFQVREIRRFYRKAGKMAKALGRKYLPAGMHQMLIAKYGVKMRTLQHIRMGTRWNKLKPKNEPNRVVPKRKKAIGRRYGKAKRAAV